MELGSTVWDLYNKILLSGRVTHTPLQNRVDKTAVPVFFTSELTLCL